MLLEAKTWTVAIVVALSASSSFAARSPQECFGEIIEPVTKQSARVSYIETAGPENKVNSVRVVVGQLEASLSTYESGAVQASFEVMPAGQDQEVVIARKTAEDIMVILQRNGKAGVLTYLNDQNLILSNAELTCRDNDDI